MSQSSLGKLLSLAGRCLVIAARNPRGLRELAGVSLAASEGLTDASTDVTELPGVLVEDIAAETAEPPVLTLRASPVCRSVTLHESVCLAVLMKRVNARRVFEFGTYRGVSTTQLALNLPPGGQVFTLDLPVENLNTKFALDTTGEVDVVQDARKGDLIPGPLRAQITFLAQDSADFDPAPYEGTMDLVFVDGAHTAEYVKNDSEKGWRMLRPGGILCWHDCRFNSPSVIRYLRQCGYGPKRIIGGTVAYAIKPG
jgi:predicted O-methyltransferase YrrM